MPSKLNVQFTARQSARLEALTAELGTTRAGVLKTALALLDVVRREMRDGGTIAVVRGQDVLREIVGIGWEG
jgi:hypothetical protein